MIVNGTQRRTTPSTSSAPGPSASVVGLPALVNITNSEGAQRRARRQRAAAATTRITASTLPAGVINLTLDGGAGDDILLGSAGADVLLGGDGNDFVDGNRGDDVAFLGAGDDIFQWDPGDGSDTVEGQDGIDRCCFNGANVTENIDISANGGRVRFFRDVANVTMDLERRRADRLQRPRRRRQHRGRRSQRHRRSRRWRPYRSRRRGGRRRRRGGQGDGQRHRRQRGDHLPAVNGVIGIHRLFRRRSPSSMPRARINWSSMATPAMTPSTPRPCPSAPSNVSMAVPATTCCSAVRAARPCSAGSATMRSMAASGSTS